MYILFYYFTIFTKQFYLISINHFKQALARNYVTSEGIQIHENICVYVSLPDGGSRPFMKWWQVDLFSYVIIRLFSFPLSPECIEMQKGIFSGTK